MFYHFWEVTLRDQPGFAAAFPNRWLTPWIQGYLDFGKIGVAVFFLISGFVIPASLAKADPHLLRHFAISRCFRLYPAYWLSILLALGTMSWTVPQLLCNLTMLQGFLGVPDLLGIYWTLQIELAFYATCALMARRGWLGRHRALFHAGAFFLAAAFVLAALRWWTQVKLPVALPLGLAVMFVGALAQGWIRKTFSADEIRRTRWLFLALVPALMAISLLAYNRDYGYGETWYRYFLSYSAALGLFGLCVGRHWLGGRALLFLGEISYSVYLLHPIILWLLWSAWPGLQGWPRLIAACLASLVLAYASHRLVERPGIALARRIAG
jgi:peptidoglycan/LPS O-acetylase OafA/YrhL